MLVVVLSGRASGLSQTVPADTAIVHSVTESRSSARSSLLCDDFAFAGSAAWVGTRDMVVREGRLFAAIGPGLVVLDITDPAEPVKLSETYMGGRSVRSVAVDGDLAFVRAQDTLAIFDVRDAAHPVFLGGTAITCQYGGIAEARDHVFAGCNEQLAVIDVSNPSQPTLTSEIPVPELGLKARIVPRDALLYLAASRFEVLSTVDPACQS